MPSHFVHSQVQGRQATRNPPVPLSTLEMQKRVSRFLRITGERAMAIAEELYQVWRLFLSNGRPHFTWFPLFMIYATGRVHQLPKNGNG